MGRAAAVLCHTKTFPVTGPRLGRRAGPRRCSGRRHPGRSPGCGANRPSTRGRVDRRQPAAAKVCSWERSKCASSRQHQNIAASGHHASWSGSPARQYPRRAVAKYLRHGLRRVNEVPVLPPLVDEFDGRAGGSERQQLSAGGLCHAGPAGVLALFTIPVNLRRGFTMNLRTRRRHRRRVTASAIPRRMDQLRVTISSFLTAAIRERRQQIVVRCFAIRPTWQPNLRFRPKHLPSLA